jgi:replicative DNA helicase
VDIDAIGRIPPHNVEAEQAVLGCMLLDPDIIPTVTELIKSSDFYRDDHREICEAIIDITEKAGPVDIITVSSYCRQGGRWMQSEGLIILPLSPVPSLRRRMPGIYAKIVEEKSLLRKLIKAASEISQASYEPPRRPHSSWKGGKEYFDILQKRKHPGVHSYKGCTARYVYQTGGSLQHQELCSPYTYRFTVLEYKTSAAEFRSDTDRSQTG